MEIGGCEGVGRESYLSFIVGKSSRHLVVSIVPSSTRRCITIRVLESPGWSIRRSSCSLLLFYIRITDSCSIVVTQHTPGNFNETSLLRGARSPLEVSEAWSGSRALSYFDILSGAVHAVFIVSIFVTFGRTQRAEGARKRQPIAARRRARQLWRVSFEAFPVDQLRGFGTTVTEPNWATEDDASHTVFDK